MRHLTAGLLAWVGFFGCSSEGAESPTTVGGSLVPGEGEPPMGEPGVVPSGAGASGDDDVMFGGAVEPSTGQAENGALGEGVACVGASAETQRVPPVLQLLIDTSGSMGLTPEGEDADNGDITKWDVTRDALIASIGQMPAETSVGVIFYPNTAGLIFGGGECLEREVSVPIAVLGDSGSPQRMALTESLAEVRPRGGTPTHDAFQFAIEELAASQAEGNKFIVLITDGAPTYALGCMGNGLQGGAVDPMPLIAEAAQAKASEIGTFVIGSPGSELNGFDGLDPRIALSGMAEAGGTATMSCSSMGPEFCHFDMTQEEDFSAALTQALEDITGRVLTCVYDIPESPQGSEIDLNKVNVIFTPSGGTPESIVKDPTDLCSSEGWRYTNGSTQIELCGATCARAQSDPNALVEIEFGCEIRFQ